MKTKTFIKLLQNFLAEQLHFAVIECRTKEWGEDASGVMDEVKELREIDNLITTFHHSLNKQKQTSFTNKKQAADALETFINTKYRFLYEEPTALPDYLQKPENPTSLTPKTHFFLELLAYLEEA